MTHVPGTALATEIATQVASLTLGTNVFNSMIRAPDSHIPVNSVFVWAQGGLEPLRTMGETNEIRQVIVHVRVRNSKYRAGENLALLIQDSLRAKSISTYLETKAAIAFPRAMGQDSDGNHYFGFEFIMTYQEP